MYFPDLMNVADKASESRFSFRFLGLAWLLCVNCITEILPEVRLPTFVGIFFLQASFISHLSQKS